MDSPNITDTGKAGKISLRLLRPSLIVLCGPAACGKSTFAERHFRATQIISSDWARARVSDDERDQRFNAQAFALVHFLAEQRLTANRLCVVDSTALTAQARKDLLDLAKRCQVPSTLLIFHVPLATCIERDEKRERTVGRAIVERQYQAFKQSQEGIHQEGFDQVVEFHDADQERVEIEILFRPIARAAQRPEPGVARKFEGPGHSFRPRAGGRGGNGHSAWNPSALPAARTEPPRPATSFTPASNANVAEPPPATSARAARTPPPLVAPQPAAGKPSPSVPSSAVPSGADAKARS
ncbi:MAG: AAA family ATPase [Terriglobia bacterium]